ncbi:MAG: ribonuclease HI [Clostridiales bacterium]|nr:ribonuclease HI [Clostridiales bacterium]
MKQVTIYTDGACSGNPGAGGYCAILSYKGQQKTVSGYEANTTNNRMELLAIIEGLKALKEQCEVQLYSDSSYCVNAFTQGWLKSWELKGWRTSDNKDVKNVELWQELLQLTNYHKVFFNKVKGHSDDELNNLCDKIARKEIEIHQKQ